MKKVINLNLWLVLFIFLIPASLPNSPFGHTVSGLMIAFFTFYFYSLAHTLFKKLQNGHDLSLQLFNLNLVFFVVLSIIDRTFFQQLCSQQYPPLFLWLVHRITCSYQVFSRLYHFLLHVLDSKVYCNNSTGKACSVSPFCI